MTDYEPNTPARPSSSLAQTQPQLLSNFQTLYEAFARNHVPLDAVSAGNHNVLELLERTQIPQTGPVEMAVYAKSVNGQTDQVFLKYQLNGQEVQLTNYQIYSLPQTPSHKQFFTFLPGGLIVYFGTLAGLNTLTLSPAVAKNIVSIQIVAAAGTTSVKPVVSVMTEDENKIVSKILIKTADTLPGIVNYVVVGNI